MQRAVNFELTTHKRVINFIDSPKCDEINNGGVQNSPARVDIIFLHCNHRPVYFDNSSLVSMNTHSVSLLLITAIFIALVSLRAITRAAENVIQSTKFVK